VLRYFSIFWVISPIVPSLLTWYSLAGTAPKLNGYYYLEKLVMRTVILLAVILFVLFSSPYLIAGIQPDHNHDTETVLGHSGGTDKYGCHTNRKTGDYHCH
jgi:hypothetical protein